MARRNTPPKTILEVANGECRWWVKADKRGVATHFCAKPAIPTTSWCEEHLMKMTSSPKALERIMAKLKIGR